MVSCADHKCQKDLLDKVQRRLKKQTVVRVAKWCGLPFLGMLVTGVVLYAQQDLRYTEKRVFSAHVAENAQTRTIVDNLVKHRDEDRAVQREIQSDVKEILRYMRRP